MKKNFTYHPYGNRIIAPSLFFAMLALIACSVVESLPAKNAKKEFVSGKASKHSGTDQPVKIYPDPFKKILHVKNLADNPLDFYVFDPEGTLVLHYKMSGREHKKISNLKRGVYLYQVFEGDAMSDSGRINIK